jgi:intraflagellar transport protein 88
MMRIAHTSIVTTSFSAKIGEKRKSAQRERTPQEVSREMQKGIHLLMEDSAQLLDEDPFLALDKAKEATRKDKTLTKHIEDHSLSLQEGSHLTFATWFHLALVYEKNGMNPEAIEIYSFLLKQKRNKSFLVRIRVNMGSLYHAEQNYTQAIKNYRMALDKTTREEKPLRFRIHCAIGNIFVETGKLQDAILEYEAVAMNADADIETCFNLLICYAQVGDVEKAKHTFLRILAISKLSSDNYSDTYPLERDDAMIEIELYEELEKSRKDSGTLLLTAGRLVSSLHHDGDWKVGYLWVRDQLKKRNIDVNHQIEMEQALQHLKRGEFESAIKILKSYETKDIALKAMVATNLSFVHFLEGNNSVADEYADIALATNRFNPNALVNKGNSLFVRENYAEAKELYLEAIGVDSTKFEAIYNLGLTNARLGLVSEAVQAFEKLHSITTNDPRVLYHVANLHEESDNEAAATKWFNVLSSVLPTDPGVLHRIGNLYALQKDDAQSLHYYSESHRLNPSNLDVCGLLAIWFVKHKLFERSIQFFKLASEIQPHEVKWSLMIGSCYRKIDRIEDAFEVYEGVRQDHPENMECKRRYSANCSALFKC